MAELICREDDRNDPSRVRRSCRRIGRAAFASGPKILRKLLQHRENAPVIGRGCADLAPGSTDRTHRNACPGRRAASSIRSNLSLRHTQPAATRGIDGSNQFYLNFYCSCVCDRTDERAVSI